MSNEPVPVTTTEAANALRAHLRGYRCLDFALERLENLDALEREINETTVARDAALKDRNDAEGQRKASLDALQREVEKHQAASAKMQDEAEQAKAAAQSEVDGIVAAARAEADGILREAKVELAKASMQVTAHKDEVLRLQDQVADLTKQAAAAQAKLDEVRAKISALLGG